jgi:hypothetical protein
MQYAKDFTDALQFMWGDGFLSPGGPEEVAEMLAGIDLSGKRVLDIGSGLGGIDLCSRPRTAPPKSSALTSSRSWWTPPARSPRARG